MAVILISAISGAASIPVLKPEQREELRYRLEALFNEADLAIRNEKVDRSDLARIDGDFKTLKVYERIPLERDIPGLKRTIEDSARKNGVALLGIDVTLPSKVPPGPPPTLYTDGPRFKLSTEQVTDLIGLKISVQGKRSRIQSWIARLPAEEMRLVLAKGLESRNQDRWIIKAEAFSFRNVQFPRLLLRDPMQVLPAWARVHTTDFARSEPLLWRFVARTRELEPRAEPLFEVRRRFLLGDARLSFFLSKVQKPVL